MYKQCTESNENSIEFSLSNADKGAVGLILALELASLTVQSLNTFLVVEVDCRSCTFTVVEAEFDDIIIKWYYISQTTVVSIYQKLFTTTSQSSIYIVDH